MLRTLLTGLLIASASAALAQNRSSQPCGWTILGESASSGRKQYIDYCKVTGTGRYRAAWTLNNYPDPERNVRGDFYLSNLTKRIYDCQLSRSGITAIYYYSDQMGHGALQWSVSFSENEWKFTDHPPSSISAYALETVCQ